MLRLALAVAALACAADRLSKWWLLDMFDLPARGHVAVTPFFNLVMVWNRGVSFGLLAHDAPLARYALAAFALGVAVFLLVWAARSGARWTAVALGLVAGGAVSNAIDRLLWGAVADFFDLHAAGYHWYAFNIADAAITIGVVLLLVSGVLEARPKPI